MKKIIYISKAILFATVLFMPFQGKAQTPDKISYQAVIRNNSGELVTNHDVGIRISILKGSEAGAAVFTQTLTTTTNANGLASFEIGGGSFGSISWDDDTYYIKTECDPAGGTNYSITGTSQILSVPYAIHAKTAEYLTTSELYVGKLYGGGIIFWLDPDEHSGLIAGLNDISTGVHWSNIQSESAGVSAESHWNGESNSTAIVAQSGHVSSAAKLCLDYETGGITDWYLPSVREFHLLFDAGYVIDKALTEDDNSDTYGLRFYYSANYWTSTECFSESSTQAFFFHYMDGAGSMNKGVQAKVRPIRRFTY